MLRSYAPNSKVTCRPVMHTSYLVMLLVQSKFSLTKIEICWPFGDTRTASTPFSSPIGDSIKINLPTPWFYIGWFRLYC